MYINMMRLFVNKLCGQPMIKGYLNMHGSEEKVNNILVHV